MKSHRPSSPVCDTITQNSVFETGESWTPLGSFSRRKKRPATAWKVFIISTLIEGIQGDFLTAKLHYTSCLDGVWIKMKKVWINPNNSHDNEFFLIDQYFCTKNKIIDNEKWKLLETLQYTIKEFNNGNVVCSTMHCPNGSRWGGTWKGLHGFCV